MTRTFAGFVLLLAVLALLSPGKAVAGPPEGVSGKMVLDEVADGLRQYRMTRDQNRRINWLERLAPTGDPRVAVALGEALKGEGELVRLAAARNVVYYGAPPIVASPRVGFEARQIERASHWWAANEADLRRRAKQLPQ
jgi:hypothetical protein